MPETLLTVDLGNSRCKLRLWEPCGGSHLLVRAEAFPADAATRAGLPGEVEAWLRQVPAPAHAVLSAVGDPALEERLRAVLAAAARSGRASTPRHGLELDVREPHTVGLDRLFAARGAAEVLRASALVLDAGTALTVDALELEAQRSRSVFRGGAIAPGPQLLAETLAARGARLLRVWPRPGARALGRSTPEALEAGVVVGFRGAARELVRAVGEESGLGAAPLVLTGGARAFLLEPPLFGERRLVESEDLVHLGLLAAFADELRTSSAGRDRP